MASTRGGRGFGLLILLAAAFYAVFIGRTGFLIGTEWHFTLFDDAMISMRYARNVADGFGPVWNPGETPVEGYTNLLWMLLMAAVHLLPLPDSMMSLAVMIVGALLLLANVWTVRRIAERVNGGRPGPALAAAALVAFYYPLVFWTLRGMEVGALALLVSLSVLLLLRLRERGSTADLLGLGVLAAAAILTRSDAVVPALVIAFFAPWLMPGNRGRGLAASLSVLVAAGAALAAHSAFRHHYYGDPLPNTYYLKMTGVTHTERLGRGAWAMVDFLSDHLALPLLIAVLGLIALPRAWRMFQLFVIALVLGQCSYSVYVGGDVWESMGGANRFVCVAMPVLWVGVASTLFALIPQPGVGPDPRRVRRWSARFAAVAGLLLLIAAGFHWFAVGEWRTRGYSVRGEQVTLVATAALLGAILLVCSIRWSSSRRTVHFDRFLTSVRPYGGVLCGTLVALLWVYDCGTQMRYWQVANAKTLYDDVDHTALGVMIHRNTEPDCTVAMAWAGSIAYFSRRPAIDTLGKNDTVIARMEPMRKFTPGHNKQNLSYSIDELRPDVVCLGGPRDMLLGFGYEPMGNDVWVRNDSTAALRDRISKPWRQTSVESIRELWRTQAQIRDAARRGGLVRQWLTRVLKPLRRPDDLDDDAEQEQTPPGL